MTKTYKDCPFKNGMNRGDAEYLAKWELGAEITSGWRDGHHVARHWLAPKPCIYNCRKKSAPRVLIGWCRRIWLLEQVGNSRISAA